MFKKIIALISVVCVVFCLFSCSNNTKPSSPLKTSEFIASKVDEKTSFRYDEYEDYIIITGIADAPDDIIIPETIADKDVKAIGNDAFRDMGWVKSIDIPDTVVEIGDGAFYGSLSTTKISLSENLYKIGSHAFFGCISLENIRLPLGLKFIGGFAFADCQKLEGFAIPNGVSSIGGGAFEGTKWLSAQKDEFVIAGENILICYNGNDEKVTVPEDVRVVSAFYDNFFLKEVTFPESVEEIGEYGFINSSITSVNMSKNIRTIGTSAFDSCLSLKKITLNEDLEEIGSFAFANCQMITEFTVSENVKIIGDGVFSRCDSLEKLTFLSDKTEIGENICESCNSSLKILCEKNSPVINYVKENGFILDVI